MLVPSIFRVEVASALTRAGVDAALTRRYLENLLSMAEVVTLGPVRTRQVQEIAMRTRLRAADAIYVWLAARENLTLVTLDQEMLARSAGLCTVAAP